MGAEAIGDAANTISIGDALADELAELDPLLASEWGLRSSRLPSFDPDWWQARKVLFSEAARALTTAPVDLNSAVLLERARAEVDWIESGECHAELQAAMDSPLFRIRFSFDDMPTVTADDQEAWAERLEDVPSAVAGLRLSLERGTNSGLTAPLRQVLATTDAVDSWIENDVFRFTDDAVAPTLATRLDAATVAASEALARIAAYLREEYAAVAQTNDAVGAERFARWSRRYAGAVIGSDDYEWSAAQLAAVDASKAALREACGAGSGRVIEGEAAHCEWVRAQIQRAAERADEIIAGAELPPIDVRPLAEHESQQAYHTAALDDGSRPAIVWITGGDGPHYVDYEQTVIFHESIPGHHVETVLQRRTTALSRFQRRVYLPGHSEGWGLYAERLAEEKGLIDTPHARLGCRGSQGLRYASLLIDVGLHTALSPPASVRAIVGPEWTIDGAISLVEAQGVEHDVAAWWVTNMVGRPGHRASYAAGERAWRELREHRGASSLAEFHTRALSAGPMGLDMLRRLA